MQSIRLYLGKNPKTEIKGIIESCEQLRPVVLQFGDIKSLVQVLSIAILGEDNNGLWYLECEFDSLEERIAAGENS